MAEKNPLYSSHIFMFPFRFDWVEKEFNHEFDFYKEYTIDERVNLQKVKKDLEKDWNYEPFDLKKDLEQHKDYMYNEFAYFYDYARDAIYNLNQTETISYYFERKLDDGKFEISILNQDKKYTLNITGLSLRIFNSGVGILSIELENRETYELKDILKINDFGRRIYPQFIAECKTEKTKKSFLANSIKIISKNKNSVENFCFTPSTDIVIGSHIMKLLGDSFTQEKDETKKYYIQPILDDRMFVISWYGNKSFSGQLIDENYIKDDNWYKYVFVDGKDKTVFSPKMQTDLIKNATYDRWMNSPYGLTLYGVSRYSFVCLSTNDFPLMHIKTMYFQMVTLLLATRASILRFSDEIASLASNEYLDTKKLNKLYQRYLTFYNRLYFKEVTHQDQGIELYDMARKQMNIDDHIEKLDKKFTKLFEFAELQANNESSESMDKLTIMGALFLPPSLMVAFFSMGIFDYDKSFTSQFIGLSATFASGILGYIIIKNIIKKKKHNAK